MGWVLISKLGPDVFSELLNHGLYAFKAVFMYIKIIEKLY
jgi:hypothetical protein